MTVALHYLDLRDRSMARVDGEGATSGFEGQIEINDWNWRAENREIKDKSGQGSGQGARVEPSLFTFSKAPDRSSVRLVQAMHQGEIFRRATFTLFEELANAAGSTEEGGDFHLAVELTDVIVNKFDLNVSSSDTEVTLEETWELNYRTIEFKYDQGAHQIKLNRPPGANDDRAGSVVDDLTKQAKGLSPPERQELIKKLGALD